MRKMPKEIMVASQMVENSDSQVPSGLDKLPSGIKLVIAWSGFMGFIYLVMGVLFALDVLHVLPGDGFARSFGHVGIGVCFFLAFMGLLLRWAWAWWWAVILWSGLTLLGLVMPFMIGELPGLILGVLFASICGINVAMLISSKRDYLESRSLVAKR